MDRLLADAWVKKCDKLAEDEVLHAEEPHLGITNYWPAAEISKWCSIRTGPPALVFSQRLHDISTRRRTYEEQRGSAWPGGTQYLQEKVQRLLHRAQFYRWVESVHSAPHPLQTIINQTLTGEDDITVRALQTFQASILGAVVKAHDGVLDIKTLLCRLHVLERRFTILATESDTIDLNAPLSPDFSFLDSLDGLDSPSLAKVLSSECFERYRGITPSDFTDQTECSRRLADWATFLQYSGQECIVAGFTGKVTKLCECLWRLGDHHSSISLQSALGLHTYDYWHTGQVEGGLLYSLSESKQLVQRIRCLPPTDEISHREDLAVMGKVILGVTEWGDAPPRVPNQNLRLPWEKQPEQRSTSGSDPQVHSVAVDDNARPSSAPHVADRPRRFLEDSNSTDQFFRRLKNKKSIRQLFK